VCTEELDVDEPLDEDEEDEDDVVLSSSLSTSFFARRGLSLTPPRRGLSLMPRASIVYVGRRRMVMAIGAVRLGCPSWLSRPRLSRLCRAAALGAGPWGWQDGLADGLLSRGLPSAEMVLAGYLLP